MEIRIESLNDINQAAREFISSYLSRWRGFALTDSNPSSLLESRITPPRVIAFYGSMGAGKTTFIKALCEELGVSDVITSPTFAIVNEYSIDSSSLTPRSPLPAPRNIQHIYHFDFYRIHRIEEVYDMGYEEYFYASNSLSLIEWPELVESLLPDDTLRINISEQPDGSRLISEMPATGTF